MEKDKITYVVKSFLAAFLSIWTLTMLGLPLCSITFSNANLKQSTPSLNGYYLFSLTSANTANSQDPAILILGTISIVILSLAIAFAIIGFTLNIINFFIKKHPMMKAISAFSIINCVSSFLYMILSIVYVIIINKTFGIDSFYTAKTYAYLYFCASLLILLFYFISQPLINNHYKQLKLQNALLQSSVNLVSIQPQQTNWSECFNTPKAVKMPDINVFDELIKYKELLDENIITQEEFDKMKSRIFEANKNSNANIN